MANAVRGRIFSFPLDTGLMPKKILRRSRIPDGVTGQVRFSRMNQNIIVIRHENGLLSDILEDCPAKVGTIVKTDCP
jgi:hypothetical protein